MKNNKFFRAVTVLAVTALLILTSFPLTALAADCEHESTELKAINQYDGTHRLVYICLVCGREISSSPSLSCDWTYGFCQCGSTSSVICDHTSIKKVYASNKDGTHLYRERCEECNEAFGAVVTESCFFNGDRVCDLCGFKCYHDDYEISRYVNIGDGLHDVYADCAVCGVEFKYDSQQSCGGDYSYSPLENSKDEHVYSVECSMCKTLYVEDSEACEFINGVCSLCDRVCSHEFENGSCSICGLGCSHVFENGICKKCAFACTHSFLSGKCTKCGISQALDLPELDFATYGTPIWEKDVKYLKTDKGFYFVVSDDYIGGRNIFNLEDHGLWLPGNSILTLLDSRYDYLYFSDPGTASPFGRFGVELKDLSKFEDRQKYTFSCLASDSKADVYLHVTDPSGKISYFYSKNDNGLITMTFEYLKENNYTIFFRTDNNRSVARPAYTVLFKRLQIEKGEKFTAYEPYYAVRCYDYETTYKKGYQDALLENGGNTGGLVSGLINSGYEITKDTFDVINKGTTINGVSLAGLIYTAIAFLIIWFVFKVVKK